jgi:preprotein translocase subunit SecB
MKPKISPENYNRIIKSLNLTKIYYTEIHASCEDKELDPHLNLSITEKSSFIQKDKTLEIIYSHNLLGTSKNNEKPSITIKAKYKIVYSINSDAQITKDFMDVFSNLTLGMTVWPYFRELVSSMLSRMNLPPLTLPMKKINV